MSKTFEVPAELRTDVGKGASRRLRREDKVPAVVYGEDKDPVALTLEHDFLYHASDEEAFHSSILDLKVGKKKQQVVLRDLQRHPWKPRIMHVDFLRVSADHAIRISVPLHFINEEGSPADRKSGVVISHQVTEIEIEALPKDLPEYIEVDLSELEPGGRVMMSEITLPEGVIIPALKYEDTDASVVAAIFIREGQGTGEKAAEADAALAEAAEPELESEDVEEALEEGEEGEEAAEGEEGEEGKSKGADSKGAETGSKENPPDKKVDKDE